MHATHIYIYPCPCPCPCMRVHIISIFASVRYRLQHHPNFTPTSPQPHVTHHLPTHPHQNVHDNTATPAMSPWRRHLELLREAKMAATAAQEGEARAVAALKAVEQRVERAQEDTASKSGEITSLTNKVCCLLACPNHITPRARVHAHDVDTPRLRGPPPHGRPPLGLTPPHFTHVTHFAHVTLQGRRSEHQV